MCSEMKLSRKILILSDTGYNPVKMYLDQMPKLAKGFVRLGHDVRHISYCGLLSQLSPFKSRSLSQFLYKKKVDETISRFAKNYRPDIIYISFAKYLDKTTVLLLRQAAPSAVFIGGDGDPWPSHEKGRIETACELDILMATNNGSFLDEYRRAGAKKCVFMPNMCDPDVDRRYEVEEKWCCDVLWTGKVQHGVGSADGDQMREQLIHLLAKRPNVRIYGCIGRPKISGIDYLYAISGAKIGVNVNAYGPVKFCHSDRLTQYLACGTFVMAKRFDGCNLLYKDNIHLRYFDTIEEFFELADYYLNHEEERKKVADAGMHHIHKEFNSTKIAGYILELIETDTYSASWLQQC